VAIPVGTPYIVVVLGRPASGKSTISARIEERWGLPVVSKDAVKEILFDTIGTGDRAWSMGLGRPSFALLDHIIQLQLRTGRPFLIDAAYNAELENEKFRRWQEQYGFVAVQIHCIAQPDELVRRFVARARDGTRHPGHADAEWVDGFRSSLTDGRAEVLDLRGPVLRYESDRAGSMPELLRELGAILPSSAA
jgi:predicted kinase